jgi:hypothetical protein
MKNWKTTLFGALAAVAIAVKPILDGSGYHFDKKTIAELTLAAVVALGGYFAQDNNK